MGVLIAVVRCFPCGGRAEALSANAKWLTVNDNFWLGQNISMATGSNSRHP
jgi:hypothetical protein